MGSKKVLSGEIVVHLLEQMLEGQDRMRVELGAKIDATNERLDATNEQLGAKIDSTNEKIDRLVKAAVGVGRVTKLEERVSRLEERAGVEPPR